MPPRSTSLRRKPIACTIDAICNKVLIAPPTQDHLVDAVLSASRVLVAIAAALAR